MHLDSALVGELAERISDARKLYGNDSPYVIGLITSIEWIAQGVEGGEDLKRGLLAQIADGDVQKPTPHSAREPAKVIGGDAASPEPAADAAERGSLTENTWIKGIVKWFNNDKGYGFISTDSNVDVFVHWRDISSWDRSLTQGDEVEFMVTRTAKGFQAINVMKAGQEKADGEGGTEPESPSAEASPVAEAAEPSVEVTGEPDTGSLASPDVPAETEGQGQNEDESPSDGEGGF